VDGGSRRGELRGHEEGSASNRGRDLGGGALAAARVVEVAAAAVLRTRTVGAIAVCRLGGPRLIHTGGRGRHGADEGVLRPTAQDARVLLQLLGRGARASVDLERKVLLFGTLALEGPAAGVTRLPD
jgi:hypothetical protein